VAMMIVSHYYLNLANLMAITLNLHAPSQYPPRDVRSFCNRFRA
jgi:hypothetical protein